MSELEIAGHRFTDAGLVETALTHSSYLHEHPDLGVHDFERLEFLGDAVVDLVIGEELYRRFPDATEGELTSLRASLVSSPALAEIGRALGLTERARLGRGEDETGGRGRMGLAASLYEAVIGAIYLDAGFDRARAVVLDTMGDAIDAAAAGQTKSAKTQLQEWAQSQKQALPTYRVLEDESECFRACLLAQISEQRDVAAGERLGRSTDCSEYGT